MPEPRWFHLCDENTRKAIAAELILGGLEIAFARDFCGIRKMPMQYYLHLRKIKRPYLGVSQRRLRVDQIRRAVELYQSGATPQEVYMLTGVALCTLNRMSYPLPPKHRGRSKGAGGEILPLPEKQAEGIEPVPESEAVPVSAERGGIVEAAQEQRGETPQPEISPPAPKRPGRSRKAAAESAAKPESAPAKRRGRPKAAATVESATEPEVSPVTPPAKRRGRPPKRVAAASAAEPEPASPTPKRRGRPRKKA